ncbi:type II methionyl aminopeptidase [Candidatus Woesearchaeota archaeon]|nr:MAG: type II methionyl aminopeptidase [Candidatus Woesearchaeota archaeon]
MFYTPSPLKHVVAREPRNVAGLSEEALASYLQAGRIAREALLYGATLIKPGALIRDVLDRVEEKIRSLGGEPAFPAQSSRNECAAHFCPDEEDTTSYEAGDCVKLDVGVHVNGYVADNALTIALSEEHDNLVKAAQAALDTAITLATPGTTPAEIGKAIEETIQRFGYQPIRNLSGHGIGHFIVHQAPTIPNYQATHLTTPLKEGDTIAIEPFATTGTGLVGNKGAPTIFSLTKLPRTRNPATRQALTYLQSIGPLPFTTRWLTRQLGKTKAFLALQDLRRLGCLNEYPPLHEKSKGIVAQAEHSIIVAKTPIVITRTNNHTAP